MIKWKTREEKTKKKIKMKRWNKKKMCSNHSHTISIRRMKQQLLLYTTQFNIYYIFEFFSQRERFFHAILFVSVYPMQCQLLLLLLLYFCFWLWLDAITFHNSFLVPFLSFSFHHHHFSFLFFSFVVVVVCVSLHASCFSPYILYESAKERSSQNYIRRYVMYSPYSVSVFAVYI